MAYYCLLVCYTGYLCDLERAFHTADVIARVNGATDATVNAKNAVLDEARQRQVLERVVEHLPDVLSNVAQPLSTLCPPESKAAVMIDEGQDRERGKQEEKKSKRKKEAEEK